jgi:endonuclease YncB( thermonuclease family)
MRKSIVVAAGLIGFSVGIGVYAAMRPSASPPALEESAASAPTPAAAGANSPASPQLAAAPPAAASAPVPAPVAPPRPAAPELPNVTVADHPIHAVPEDEPLIIPSVTFVDRKGRERHTEQVVLAPSPPSPAPAALPMMPAIFTGAAQAMGGAALAIGGRPVRLFGVRLGDPRDRCGLGPGDARSCADVARDMLAQRLKRYPTVSCHMPPGQRGDPAAVCIDSSGTDLGGFLVAEGYALADTTQSYEYFGSEGVARSFRRGLWHNR